MDMDVASIDERTPEDDVLDALRELRRAMGNCPSCAGLLPNLDALGKLACSVVSQEGMTTCALCGTSCDLDHRRVEADGYTYYVCGACNEEGG